MCSSVAAQDQTSAACPTGYSELLGSSASGALHNNHRPFVDFDTEAAAMVAAWTLKT